MRWSRFLRAIGREPLRRAEHLAKAVNRRRIARGYAQVVFLGDSITEFWPDNDPRLFLTNDWINAGIRGETTAGLRARFECDVIAVRPHAVHIMGGTNDLWRGHPGIGAADAIANIEAMVAMAGEAGIAVILAPPPPLSSQAAEMFDHPGLYRPLCAAVEEIAHRQGVIHVDYAKSLLGADGEPKRVCFTDGVHLTRQGYLAIRDQARDAVRAALR